MIGGQDRILAGQEAWSEHLRDIFNSLSIPSGTVADNLTASVAMYCRQFHPMGIQHSDLLLLIARAFCAINDRDAALRVLRSSKPHARHAERWLEILSELHQFPSLLPLFSLGIIRPADWAGAQLDRMWTLDLGRLALSESEKHEMMLYRSIRSILENMFAFWDATGGEGTLGLKGLASFNVESDPKQPQTLTTPQDLLGYIGNLFLKQQEARHWQAVPALLNLGL